jgi:hypothetical protein
MMIEKKQMTKDAPFIGIRLPLHGFAALWLLTLAGCSTWGMPKSMPWPLGSDDSPTTPAQVVVVWTDAVQHQVNQPPIRGFGGRIMFYDGKSEKPVKVDGTLAIYAFDESGRDPNNARPDRKFVYPPEKLPSHYSKSQIGHSYSIWVPWDKAGGIRKEVTLITRFLPKNGAPVVCDCVRQVLPGEAPSSRAIPASFVSGAGAGTAAQQWSAYGSQESGQTPSSNGRLAGRGAAFGVVPADYPPTQVSAYDGTAPMTGAFPLPQRHMLTTSIPIRPGLATGPTPYPPPTYPMTQAAQTQVEFPARMPVPPAESWYPQPAGGAMVTPQVSQPPVPSGFTPPPRSRYTPPRFQPLGVPIARLDRDQSPPPRYPTGWQSGPALPTGSASAYGSTAPQPAAVQSGY